MFTLPDHFCILLTRIEPEEDRAKIASDLPAQVRDFLQNHEDITTAVPHTRLAGSYARHTALKNIKDVDVLLLLDTEYQKQSPAQVIETVFSALRTLPEALDDKGETSVRRHQRRSVNIHLEIADFDLDIVPAIALDGLDEPLIIPDKDWNEWVETHPLGYSQELSNLNGDHEGKVVPLIKLLKHWRDIHMCYRRPKSYWLECLVYQHIAAGTVTTIGLSYAELFHDMLETISNDFLSSLNAEDKVPEIKDPMLGHNVAHNWQRAAFETFMRRVEESLGWAKKALAQPDEMKAVEFWQKVFGAEWFPEDVTEEKGKQLNYALLTGNVFVGSNGMVHIGKPTSPVVQPLSQRFYGEI